MAIIKWNPFREIERFFEEDLIPMVPTFFTSSDFPVDIYEEDNNLVVEVALAGVQPENVEVKVEDNRLKIQGKVEEKKETKEENYWRREIRRGNFQKIITLPYQVEADKANAQFKDGMLKIVLPKKGEEEKGISIPINK